MQIIKGQNAVEDINSDKCKVFGYSFEEKDMDTCIAVITGRYPDSGYCKNVVCKELIYILGGSGKLYFEDKVVEFSEGDAVWISANEKYYWDTHYCKASITSSPAWYKEQYEMVK